MFKTAGSSGPFNLCIICTAAAMMFLAFSASQVTAQGLNTEGAVDTIVGSEVTTGEERATSDEARIVAAIENSSANASDVRKKFSLDRVEIIFLPDLGDETTEVEAKLEEYKPQVTELRESIQGNAMFYHAIDSRSIMLNRIVAIEFDDNNGVTIFVAGEKPPGQ